MIQSERLPHQPFHTVAGHGIARGPDRYCQSQPGLACVARAGKYREQSIRGPDRLLEDPFEVCFRLQTAVCAEPERIIGGDGWIRLLTLEFTE